MKKLIKDFLTIENTTDLKKRNLSLADYDAIHHIIYELQTTTKSYFIQKSIFVYFHKFNLKIKKHGIGWQVEL